MPPAGKQFKFSKLLIQEITREKKSGGGDNVTQYIDKTTTTQNIWQHTFQLFF